jgi:hypothetical protein
MPRRKKSAEEVPVTIVEEKEVALPDPPQVGAGEMAMRMVYSSGKVRDVVAGSMLECSIAAQQAAKEDGFNFRDGNHIVSWERVV